MTPISKCKKIGILAILILFLMAPLSYGKIFEWKDSPNRQDLLLLGFGELTLHNLSVDGDKDHFESANPSLEEGFFANYRLSMFANGDILDGLLINGAAIVDSRIDDEYRNVDPSVFRLRMSVETTEPLWDGWRFTGSGLYDPNRQWDLENLDKRLLYQPQEPSQLELLMRLESDKNGYLEAGSLRPSFKDAKFTLHQRSLFGVYADLHTEHVGAEAVAGKLEGKGFRHGRSDDDVISSEYGIRADGSSGPFQLDKSPVTRGSEEVKIQTRDRFNESTVIDTRTLLRDIDYTVDYITGRILLHQPIASESAASDPVYIVITYDYLREANDELYGGRGKVMPIEDVQISGSILHRNIKDPATGEDIDEPEDLYSGDLTFKIDDHTKGYAEFANSNNKDDDTDYQAFRAGIESELISNLKLTADFQKIDDQFNSFTNSDLNPTKNQRRLNLGGIYELDSGHTVSAGYSNYRGLDVNGEFNKYNGIRDEEIYQLGYRNEWIKKLNFGIRVERREVEDVENTLKQDDNYQNRAMLDVDGKFENFPILGQFGYKAGYELIMFRQELNVDTSSSDPVDANTNQLAVSLSSVPTKDVQLNLTQRFTARKLLDADIYDERQDATFASAQIKLRENLNTLTTFEYKRYTNPGDKLSLIQDDPEKVSWAGTFAVEYLPLEKFKVIGRAGRTELETWVPDSTKSTTDFLLGQITYFHTHHLSFNAESEFQRKELTNGKTDKVWDLGLKMNWNKDRLNEFTAGMIRRSQDKEDLDESSTSYIVLVNGSLSLTHHFFARAAIKGILLESVEDEKTFAKIELGFDSHSWYRVSLGYERIQGSNEEDSSLDYTGQGLFIRFTGKM